MSLRIGSKALAFIGPFAFVFGAGCVAATSETSSDNRSDDIVGRVAHVQMNDVSVLYPLARTSEEATGYLSPWSEALGGQLFPESIYDAATGSAPSSLTGKPLEEAVNGAGLDYGNLRAVAFRIDPCFAHVGPITEPESCQNQLRIVFQSMLLDQDGHARATDDAVHAFYSLTRDDLRALVSDIVKLRRAEGEETEDLGPLAVHPVLVKQGLLGGFAKGFAALVTKYAGQKNFMRFTAFTSPGGFQLWLFNGFDIDANGKSTPMVIPTLPNATTTVSFATGGLEGFDEGAFNPATTSADDIGLLTDVTKAKAAPEAAQKAAFDAALRIANPDFHSPDTIDCASCHVAVPASILTGSVLGLSAEGNANAFVANERFVSKANMAQTTPMPQTGVLNIHMFSYKGEVPMITSRTINETASVVTYLNGTVFANQR